MRTHATSRFVGLLTVALCASTAFVLNAATPVAASGFSAGDIVVVRVGTGSAALSGAATEVFLDEYTPSGTLVQSVALPTAAVGTSHRVTMSGVATAEGALALSADGRYLSLAGFDATPGTAAVAGTSTTSTSRVVARVDGDGLVDSSTAITDAFNNADIRGAVTDDGNRFWAVGTSGGVRLAAFGSTGATTQINSAAPTNLRVAGIADGQLYVSTGSAPSGVYAIGSGLPTTGSQTTTPVTPTPSPYGFVALDRDPVVAGIDTVYVADDSASPNGGIVKFSFDGTAWTSRGSFRPSGTGVRGLTGAITAGGVTLYATTSTTTNQLVMVSDSSAFDADISATSTALQAAPANTVFRGVAFAPSGGGAGAPTIGTQPQDTTIATGATATLTVGAAGGGPLGYQWYAGVAGDTGTPVGNDAPSFTTPVLTTTTSYWVRVTGPGGVVDSATATVTVGPPTPACTSGVVSVGSVQGPGDISPVAGQTVSVRGTVVADDEGPQPTLRGFYLQDAGDGDPATSDGIFVFDNGANLVANGDVVQVAGPVSEFQGQTQLTANAAGVQSCGQQAAVTPVDVTLPRAAAADLEPYEGMLVRLHQTVYVTEHFQLGRFGQVVVSAGDRLRQPTADIRATDQAMVQVAQHANDLNRLIIDDADQAQNPDPIVFGRGGQPLSASNTLRGGDSLTDAVGVMTYTWAGNAASGNAYRLRPVGALGGAAVFEPVNARPSAPPDVGSGGIKIASANLLNFFNTFTGCRLGSAGATTDCRGATDDTEYQRQLAKEVASLRFLGADVVGYMEMENDGYGPTSAVQALVNALNAADGPGTWAFVDPDGALGVVDVAGTDAIKAGVLYRTASVSPVPGATFVDQNAVFERQPVAQTFQTAAGARFTVIANHFKSKGSCPTTPGPDSDLGDGQGCWNAHRTDEATELASWVSSTVIPGAGDPDVAIVGDLNSYAGEDPIAALQGAGYTNLVKAFHGDEAYSYVFDGQWGYLDYVMASSSLLPQVSGAADVHHNADEPAVLDYNTDFKLPGQIASLYAPDRFRTSDHDPVLAGLALGAPATITGSPPGGTVGVPYSYAFALGGAPPVATVVTIGSPPPGLALSTTGELTGTPTAGGTSTFTIQASNAYGSSDGSFTVSIATAATTTVVTSSANPSTIGSPVQFAAAVSGAPTGGTVQFKVDGQALAGPVAVVNGVATSPSTSTLTLGSHAVTADYSGNGSYRPSSGSLIQLVRVGIKVLFPTAGARFPGRFIIPIAFQLTDAKGKPISDISALQLVAANRVTISASGVQSFAASRPLYDPILTHAALFAWRTAQRPTGVVTISISVTYPQAPTQVVTIPILLT